MWTNPIFHSVSGAAHARLLIAVCLLWCAVAGAHDDRKVSLDADRGAVLPSMAGDVFFQQRRQTLNLYEDKWEITSDKLSRVEGSLAKELKRNRTGEGQQPFPNYYRQYFPARKGSSRVIVVIGFSGTAAEWFPDKGIPPDQWKHELEMAFDGGCAFWHAIYSMEKRSFLALNGRQTIICNGPG